MNGIKIKTQLIPVIHMLNEKQVLSNVDICTGNGIKKVFIINHQVSIDELIECAYTVSEKNPSLWVGINMLGLSAQEAISTRIDLNALWCDETITPLTLQYNRKFHGIIFGGLAFKYQRQPEDLKAACEEARLATDVATTSGPGTGQAANIEKIKTIREYLGHHPMAIASGVSVDNVENYKGIANYLLVASSITDKNEMIIEDKLIELKTKLDE